MQASNTDSPKLKSPPKAYKSRQVSPILIKKNTHPIQDKFYETLYKTSNI